MKCMSTSGRIDSSAQIYDIQSMNFNIELNCPHCCLYVRVSPCCQEALNHLVVTMEACNPQWCHTSLKGNVSEWVSEVSCHRLVDTCPVTNAMLQCSENVATVHKKRSIMLKKCIMHHHVVLIIDDTGQVKGETCTVQLKCTVCLFYRVCWPVKCGYITPTWNMNTVTIRYVYLGALRTGTTAFGSKNVLTSHHYCRLS